MNKKGQDWGMGFGVAGLIIGVIFVLWVIIGGINSLWRISKASEEQFFQYILSSNSEIPPGYEYKFPTTGGALQCH